MAGGGGTQQSLRKALGALKDSTKVGLAKVNSEYKELDVAIVKATNHDEQIAKEKHIRTILDAVSATRPRADIAYCINSLARRLAKTHNWAVALKILIVIHRTLREADPTFQGELIDFTRSSRHMLNLSHFKDDSSPNAWDYSAWVRTYALYLEERVECFRVMKYDVETEQSKMKELDTVDLLEHLPALQQLLFRLVSCQPEGAAVYNNVIQCALSFVSRNFKHFLMPSFPSCIIHFCPPPLKKKTICSFKLILLQVVSESVQIYAAIDDGILNLVNKFFDMQRHDAVRALEIYRKAGYQVLLYTPFPSSLQAERLSEFYEICKGLNLGLSGKFTKINQPPEAFLKAMEEYVKEAPRPLLLPRSVGDCETENTPKAILAIEDKKDEDDSGHKEVEDEDERPETMQVREIDDVPADSPVADLLGLDDFSQDAAALEDKNALALAILTDDNLSCSTGTTGGSVDLAGEVTGWEVALVTAPTSNGSAVAESKLVIAGGLDKLTLDSLYDDAMARRSNQNGGSNVGQVAPNSFENDPFQASNSIAPPINVQMADMSQQQALIMNQQQIVGNNTTNPFGDPYGGGMGLQPYQPQNPYTGFL
ncbi:hypothetical protein Taro_001199 [Colocasia esculenta]|uniref:ENTH domain-containing protein n=1 Tax=Colocasia esculenta TaxID=4460 RepID=A0A843TFA6_COLES|nr:hypothetical protein [Colocasia esculenta]